MRKFKLINAEGQEFDLMRKDAFFFSPSGLGYEMQFDTTPAGYDFIELDSEMLQKTVSGSMVFAGYEQYEEFALFISKELLQLAYQPFEEWRYINCKIARLTKGEKESGSHRLISDVDFLCLSTWYESLKVVNTEVDPGIGKTYSYHYPYSYTDQAVKNIRVDITGSIPSYCRLNIIGPCLNPSWALTQGKEVLIRGKVFAEIIEGHKLVVDSSPARLEIAEYTKEGSFVQNLYQKSDFSTSRFVILPVGKSTLNFSHDRNEIIEAYLEVEQLARTV